MKNKITVLFSCVGISLLLAGCQAGITPERPPEAEVETVSEGKSEIVPEEKTVSPVSWNELGNYAYIQLSKEEQELYGEIFEILDQMKEDVMIHTLDADGADKVFQFVMTDHPELFFVEGYVVSKYTTNDIVTHLTFSGKYGISQEERESRQQKIKEYVNQFLQNAPLSGTDYEKTKYVYEYIINHTEYSELAEDSQNICSVFINGESVCQGYARATQYLLREMGVFATMVTGTINTGESHAWNLVKMEDTYCYVDTTWGDASYLEQTSEERTRGIDYDYLGADDAIMSKTHISDQYLKIPPCNSLAYYYYVKENQYFTSYQEEKIGNLFARGYQAGWESVTIKCSDDIVYSEMVQKLLNEERIFRFIEGTGEIHYATMKEKQMLIIYL